MPIPPATLARLAVTTALCLAAAGVSCAHGRTGIGVVVLLIPPILFWLARGERRP